MTDHSALIERLEKYCPALVGAHFPDLSKLIAEAAAALRDQQAKMQMMQARLDRWEPRPVTTPMLPVGEHRRCNKILAALGQAYPRTCFVCRLGPCHDEIIPHALPSAPNQAKEAGE